LKLTIFIDGTPYEVEVETAESAAGPESGPMTIHSSVLPPVAKPGSSGVDEVKVARSPLAGVVARLHAKPGERVGSNDLLLVLDAMKMEIKITAQAPGTVKSIEVAPGDAVKPDQILVVFE
jgi:biotin carboxyl carrier protein